MKSILVVDDNKLNLASARTVLGSDYRVIPVMKGQQALTYLESGECDIILLDINMPDMDGFELLDKIRKMEHCRSIPVIFLTADNDAETETRCFNAGAVDFIAKPFVPEVMLSRIARALELEELRLSLADRLAQKTQEVSDIKSQSHHDALTGLWDRAYMEESVGKLLECGRPGALIMIDIDNFKSVNDRYGHATGDKMLIMLADTLRSFSGEEDVLCRLGGDEFVVFMPSMTVKAAVRDHAEDLITEINQKIAAYKFEVDTSVSIGIALAPADGTDFTTLYRCADKALYFVKRNGKNSYRFSSGGPRDDDDGTGTVDLRYLQEFFRRSDIDKGAYLLDIDSFRYVYNFIWRFVDRNKLDVTTVLFTIGGNDTEQAMERLESTICTYLRRSDVAARYSDKQLVAILMDASNENSIMVAERIVSSYHRLYPDTPVHMEYSIARMDGWLIK